MFIGHFGVGFGAKAIAPNASLGSLFLATQFIDLLWPTLLLIGAEQVRIEPGITRVTPLDFVHYPISHSLLAVIGWAVLFAAVYLFLRRYPRGAVVLGLAVVSHWLLDFVVHRPDLPLYPGSTDLFGLGLWSSVGATVAVELPIFLVGLWLYLRATEASDAVGRWALWGLVGFLIAIYFSNLLGAPPPNVTVLAWVGQAQWLLIAWGYWIDQHRRLVVPSTLSSEVSNAQPQVLRTGRQHRAGSTVSAGPPQTSTLGVRMTLVPKKRQWLVAAVVLAVGLPLLVLGGFTLTAAGVMAIDAMRSATTHMDTSLGAWWSAGFVAVCVSHWFLVRWCVSVGGWRALILGLGGCVLVVAAALAMSSLEASLQPNDSMAGLGTGLFAFVLSFFVLLAVAMGAVAHRVDCKRAGATSGLERTDNAG